MEERSGEPLDDASLDSALRAAFRARAPSGPPSVLDEIDSDASAPGGVHVPDLAGEIAAVTAAGKAGEPDVEAFARLGRFEVLGEIAAGGVGVVFQGRDPSLGRDVAIKVLHERHSANSALVRRFVAEARIAGQLQHPGIVPVYELGLDARRRPYFAMKLVRGETLASLLSARTDPAHDRSRFLGIFERVCETVGYAHARGVVHRDLKPSNVMVGSFGEVQVVDWGLAKLLRRGGAVDDGHVSAASDSDIGDRAARAAHSLVGSVLGTPAYMAPEQARGEVEALDERSDVFALGAILCEILTGAPPYGDEAGRSALDQAAACELESARERLERCGAERELTDLALACLRRDKPARPRNAAAIASALAAYLGAVDERARAAQVAAAEARVREENERRMRRRTLALSTALVLVLVVGGGAAWWLEYGRRERAERAERTVASTLQEASHLAGQGRWSEALSQIARAEAVVATGDVGEAVRGRVSELATEIAAEASTDRTAREGRERQARFVARVREIRATETDDASDADEGYTQAFLDFGLDVAALDPAEVGAAVRALAPEARDAGWLALDDWAWRRVRNERRDSSWRHLIHCAKEADPDPLRGAIRDASLAFDTARLRELAEAIDPVTFEPQTVDLFAYGLAHSGEVERAVEVLEAASREHPEDFWLHYHLAQFLPRTAERPLERARSHAMVAVGLRPQSASARTTLAGCLRQLGDLDGARDAAADALRVDPENGWARSTLASLWYESGDLERALAIARDDSPGPGRTGWGELWLARQALFSGDFAGALQASDAACDGGANGSEVHSLRALALQETGRYADALAEYALARQDAADERVEYERESNEREARGGERGRHGPWGPREGDDRGERQLAWSAACEQMLALVPTLDAWLAGGASEIGAADRLTLARMAQHRGAYAHAARLYDVALASSSQAKSPDTWMHDVDAACARARAGFGLGIDASSSTADERSAWRGAALAALRSFVAPVPTRPDPSGRPHSRPQWPAAGYSGRLRELREPERLAALDYAERELWNAFWTDHEARSRLGPPIGGSR